MKGRKQHSLNSKFVAITTQNEMSRVKIKSLLLNDKFCVSTASRPAVVPLRSRVHSEKKSSWHDKELTMTQLRYRVYARRCGG